ncbi:MAG: DNA mismatch repair endonuclease MutL [Gemmatimonadetes bacterium]|uniref:DNA mismatch repair protein MutL n=1 Tax=Candidatus Kutchimonas denitrificans TaxID=3056748 RepID=A0AAE4Z901_9BACT|nr:DNA mismatch repair endonuclease MutL [Gemmatimonadota bacterium]NIR76025.1 DNA mismatch repair endonuclease MutL [Candidatus Kutchimonas denitrificans]NIS02217.1 DNA mismatch repair endonuclease MutL [Gemmatimonadota bacterium]NIT68043.1 DNA mismatch repair endonuclease MutL [Gemmatimonadota bacterium]NIU54069.1 DNA mismatch repair endonuclease MutL [Gemmatimonadota bacterium]
MQRRIHILPDHIANQIAAGEVVERPASAVKELIENALDARARRIEIDIRNGGKTELRVSDDGHGMVRDDALLAIDRHATSKISEASDLRAISTLGFRGEALPSIAAISKFELETAPAEGGASGGSGTRIRINGGRVVAVDEIARQPGTTVTVRSLFFNVPARAKFLRSAAAESRAVSETTIALALANLSASFRLRSNDRELLDLPRTGDLAARIESIWGPELASTLIPIDYTADGVRVAGLVQRPADARSGSRRVYQLVNGRPFVDRFTVRAAEEAYRTTIPHGHRPALFLYLELPPDEVDVNVHPTKAEVRFRNKMKLESTITEAVRSGLEGLASAPGLGRFAGPSSQLVSARRGARQGREGAAGSASTAAGQMALFVPSEVPAREAMVDSEETADEPSSFHAGGMWQLHNTYLLAETRSGVIIVDQHSAHERVLFERAMRDYDRGSATSQRLLFPITLRLSPTEMAAVDELQTILRQVGFELEPFGSNTVIIHAVPNPHPHFDAERCFTEMVDELATGSPLVDSARNQHERVAKSFACKAAIKAGQPLSEIEMEELFDQLFAAELPSHDVHGRPTILRLSMDELARRFGRT